MKFQVKAVDVGGHYIELSEHTHSIENVYTLLVGRNAVGKTRTLGKVANSYIFNKDQGSLIDEVIEARGSVSAPSQVVAVSNSRFDRFPNPGPFVGKFKTPQNYHYLGLSGLRSTPAHILSKSIAAMILKTEIERDISVRFDYIMDYIGFLPHILIEFRATSFFSRGQSGSSISNWEKVFSRTQISRKYDFENDILPALTFLAGNFRSGLFTLRYDLFNGWSGGMGVERYLTIIPWLLESGMIQVSRIHLYDKRNKNKLPLEQASSGQQCMFLMFFGIASVIKNGALICIDEPEISLHPRWQAEFIGILQGAFAHYHGCHFLIATHSPQLVSGLTSSSGFVADLEAGHLLRAEDYAKKSADFQLSEVFHEPGFKNEYLIRVLLVILSKVTKGEPLNSEDRSKLKTLDNIRRRLDETDPVLHLLNQVKVMVG